MAIFVAEMEAALRLWRDVLGFRVIKDSIIPDGPAPAPNVYLYPALLDDIFKVKNARSRMAILVSAEGAIIELQQCENPAIARSPPEHQRYGHTGIHELGLLVNDIDGWFARIREAGYATQTEYVWPCGDFGRSFLFFDADGNMIQLWEHTSNTTSRGANT
jgi:catechol 2,3-dioxygenase-like lactoylglutathione lyase family enzyme